MFSNFFYRNLFKLTNKLKFILILVFMIQVMALNAAIIIGGQSFSKTEPKVWFDFEKNDGISFRLEGSQFFVPEFSSAKYYPTTSIFFDSFDKSEDSLGLRVSWARVGNFYADLVPELKKELFVDNIVSFSIWIWSPNYKHSIAAVFKQDDGYRYTIPIAKLNFKGWKRFNVVIPQAIRRQDLYRSGYNHRYTFDRFRIYTDPNEKVGNVFIFLDKMIVVEEQYLDRYDGYAIEKIIKNEILNKTDNEEKTLEKNEEKTSEEKSELNDEEEKSESN